MTTHSSLRTPGNTRFVLLGYPRCGSTLLAYALEGHSQIRMFHELFHRNTETRARLYGTDKPVPHQPGRVTSGSGHRSYQDGEDAEAFLKEAVFYERGKDGPAAVGFKLFYDHGRGDPIGRKLWDYISRETDIKLIHLKRKNLFHQLVSRERARLTNQWVSYTNTTGAREPICQPFTLAPGYCVDYFERLRAHYDWVANTLQGNPIIEIAYEDISGPSIGASFFEIASFLGLINEPPRIRTQKIAGLPPQSQILNYRELKAFFAHTQFEAFFV